MIQRSNWLLFSFFVSRSGTPQMAKKPAKAAGYHAFGRGSCQLTWLRGYPQQQVHSGRMDLPSRFQRFPQSGLDGVGLIVEPEVRWV